MDFDSILSHICIILSLLCTVFIHRSYSITTGIIEDGLNSVCGSNDKIKLKSGENSVLIIHDGGQFSSFSGRYPFNCKFSVRARDDEGIYVVIQELNFREKDDGECLDYVELLVPANNVAKFLGAENKSVKKFCGVMAPGMWLSADDSSRDEEVNLRDKSVAPNAYVAYDGQVVVEVVISHDRLIDPKKLVMKVAFTSFKKHRCSESPYNCRLGECIHSSFFDDDIQNCPYLSCADENGCKKFLQKNDIWPQTVAGTGIGTKVTFSAVGAVLLILLKFGLVLWLCKRLRRRRARQIAAPIPTHPISRQASVELPQPSAPPLQELETKDLPPSYDSLYPEGPRTETHT